MFVALEAFEPRFSGIFGGFLNILTKPKVRLEARTVENAAYGVITAARPRRDPDWRRIEALAGRYAGRMLLPEGLVPPPPIKEASCPRFERRVLLETAIKIIKRTRMPMYRRVAGLVDISGGYADFLFPLLCHYTTVKVITGKAAIYTEHAEYIMNELGAPVIICDDYTALSDCVLIIAPDGIETEGRLVCPVLSKTASAANQQSNFITDLKVVPSDNVLIGCPHGIEPHRFIAALYEYCGLPPDCFAAGRMRWKYRQADINEVVLDVMRAAGIQALI